ncbi:MAG: DUF1109 family protein [Myxococcales bacterium]|nr:DUF1109 family protein [Myxococcales bacterium]
MNSEDSISESLAQLQARANLQPPPELRARVCSRCTHDLRPRRGLSRGARLLLSALLGTGTVLLLWIVGGRGPDTLNAVLLGTAAWGGVLGAVLLLGLGRTGTCPASAGARWAMLILLPIAFCGGLMFVSQHMLPMTDFFRADQVWRVLPCGSLALGIGALVSGGIMLLWRRTDPFSPGLSGALVGLLGGLVGSVGIGFACPNAEGWHMGLGHGLTLAALVGLGWLLGKRLLPP